MDAHDDLQHWLRVYNSNKVMSHAENMEMKEDIRVYILQQDAVLRALRDLNNECWWLPKCLNHLEARWMEGRTPPRKIGRSSRLIFLFTDFHEGETKAGYRAQRGVPQSGMGGGSWDNVVRAYENKDDPT